MTGPQPPPDRVMVSWLTTQCQDCRRRMTPDQWRDFFGDRGPTEVRRHGPLQWWQVWWCGCKGPEELRIVAQVPSQTQLALAPRNSPPPPFPKP